MRNKEHMNRQENSVNYCTLCGKKMNEFEESGGIFIDQYMGYGSKYDMERVTIRLCNKCADNLISKCTISPFYDVDW